MDNRATALKHLFLDIAKDLDPEMAQQALTPEGEKAVDAIADSVVKAFDILMQKPSA